MLARAAALLGAFDEAHPRLGVAELARRTGLARSTVHRLAGELVRLRLLDRAEGGTYRLGMRLFELGELVPTRRTLTDAALPLLEDLLEATHQRIHLAVLDGVEVVYVAILGAGEVDVASRTGGRLPAHATGVGKAMLAYAPPEVVRRRVEAGLPRLTPRTITTPGALTRELARIRAEGTAYDREESTVGVSCVAAPVVGTDGRVRAALSVTGRTAAIDPVRYGVAVRAAAVTLGRTLREAGL
ncbi:IclR family transcriptional regulator [Phycicoccus endophyticus]|nr:IclR family transcriptional regulator [Phycicoccus endophyticus]